MRVCSTGAPATGLAAVAAAVVHQRHDARHVNPVGVAVNQTMWADQLVRQRIQPGRGYQFDAAQQPLGGLLVSIIFIGSKPAQDGDGFATHSSQRVPGNESNDPIFVVQIKYQFVHRIGLGELST